MAPTAPLNNDHDLLRQTLESEGLTFLGVASVPPRHRAGDELEGPRDRYRRWLADGNHGTMAFLERHEPGKYDPDLALEGTQAVIVAGLGYYQPRDPAPVGPGPATGRIARYAWGRDYHKVVLAKLKAAADHLAARWPDARWRSFTDTAPLDERWWAERAGASFTARNTLAINRDLGSWFVLGEILTTHPFAPTAAPGHAHGSCPSSCRRCSAACPTGALADGQIDARRCLAYLTIEHRGPIADEFKAPLGSWLFGCDLCQEVCPFNLKAKPTAEPQFLAWKAGAEVDLAGVLDLDDAGFTARFGGSPVHRTGRAGLVRNACLVAANTGRRDLLAAVAALRTDPDPGVADAAAWAVVQLTTREETP